MKKLLLVALIIFPLIVFALVNFSASLIGWQIPLPAERIEVSLDNENWSTSAHLALKSVPANNAATAFVRIVPGNARNLKIAVYNSEEDTAEIISPLEFDKSGRMKLDLAILNYGFTEFEFVTEDGGHSATLDIEVFDPDADPQELKGLIFQYKEPRHQGLRFGAGNPFTASFKYFPTTVTEENLFRQMNVAFAGSVLARRIVREGVGLFTLQLAAPAAQRMELAVPDGTVVGYTFNGYSGYNFDETTPATELVTLFNSGEPLYQLSGLKLAAPLVVNGNLTLWGNDYTISLAEIAAGIGLSVTGSADICRVHVLGPLVNIDGQIIPNEKLTNVRFVGTESGSRFVLRNSTIENGRYNLHLVGKSSRQGVDFLPTEFILDNVQFTGALLSAINVDASSEGALLLNSGHVQCLDLDFAWVTIPLLVQNSAVYGNPNKIKGYSVVEVLPKRRDTFITSINTKRNWRNLDEAADFLRSENILGILKELKTYEELVHQAGEYYYVSPMIVFRGGAVNYGQLRPSHEFTLKTKFAERRPSQIEALHPKIGGRYPFKVYVLDPSYYEEDSANE